MGEKELVPRSVTNNTASVEKKMSVSRVDHLLQGREFPCV